MRKEIVFGTTAALLMLVAANVQAQLNEERFVELLELVVPAEKTKLIDWQPDLLTAQKIALQQRKPMFIWSMDGHPLGCT